MLYVKELHKTIVVDDLTNVPNSESVWCELNSTKSSLVIGVCHHITSASVENEVALHNVIGQVCHRYKNVLFCHDFNHRTIDWDLLQCDSEGQKFLNLTFDCFHHQHANESTTGENILDLVLSSSKSMVDNLVVHERLTNSNHDFITFYFFCDVSMTYWKELHHDFR